MVRALRQSIAVFAAIALAFFGAHAFAQRTSPCATGTGFYQCNGMVFSGTPGSAAGGCNGTIDLSTGCTLGVAP